MPDANQTISRTGKLLLDGWKMLAQMCPMCNTALMSKQGALHCPGCDLPVRYETSREDARFDDAAEEEEEEEEEHEDDAQVPRSLEELKREYDVRNKSRDLISKKLGEKMLAGWTLLGVSCEQASCSGTPLMHSQKEPMKLVCVACERVFRQNKQGELEPAEGGAKVAAAPLGGAASLRSLPVVPSVDSPEVWRQGCSDAPILDFSRSSREQDSSSRLAAKLMLGWAMLNEVCPRDGCTGSPLVRDLQSVKRCVDCNHSWPTGATGGPSSAPPSASSSSSSSSAAVVRVAGAVPRDREGNGRARRHRRRDEKNEDEEEDDEDDEDDEDEDEEDQEAYRRYAAKRMAPAAPVVGSRSRAAGTSSRGGGGSSEVNADENEALKLCRARLLEAARKLEGSSDTAEATRLAVLVVKLSRAVGALKELLC